MRIILIPDNDKVHITSINTIPRIGEQVVLKRGNGKHDELYIVNNIRHEAIDSDTDAFFNADNTQTIIYVSLVCWLR